MFVEIIEVVGKFFGPVLTVVPEICGPNKLNGSDDGVTLRSRADRVVAGLPIWLLLSSMHHSTSNSGGTTRTSVD